MLKPFEMLMMTISINIGTESSVQYKNEKL